MTDRFWNKVDKTGACWLWTAGLDKCGYGRFFLHQGKRAALAHRVAYEDANGPVPDGLVIDHLCRNRACVNPAHLEAVTQKVNCERGDYSIQGQRARERQTAKTHCPQGHEYSQENTYVIPSSGGRACRKCGRLKRLAYESRQRALKGA